MITITENRTHIMQMREDYKIAEVKKADIIDFVVNMNDGDLRIIFTTKGDFNTTGCVTMHFVMQKQFDEAIAELICITDRIGI